MEIPVEGANANVVTVDLYYAKGGMNYFTGDVEKRGLKLSVIPEFVSKHSRSYTGFSGIKRHVKDLNRFSQKALDNFEVDTELVEAMVNHVLVKNQLKRIA